MSMKRSPVLRTRLVSWEPHDIVTLPVKSVYDREAMASIQRQAFSILLAQIVLRCPDQHTLSRTVRSRGLPSNLSKASGSEARLQYFITRSPSHNGISTSSAPSALRTTR